MTENVNYLVWVQIFVLLETTYGIHLQINQKLYQKPDC